MIFCEDIQIVLESRHETRLKPVAPVVSSAVLDISLLQAAKALLQHCNGDATSAALALKHVASLQMG